MVDYAGEYQWSSYLCHAYGSGSRFHVPHPCYLELQPDADQRLVSYRHFVASPMPEAVEDQIRYSAIAGLGLGSEGFQKRMKKRDGGAAGTGAAPVGVWRGGGFGGWVPGVQVGKCCPKSASGGGIYC